MSIIPLLNGKWEMSNPPVAGRKEGIAYIKGKWFEDDREYTIEVPEQLSECLIELQNHFAERYRKIEDAKSLIREMEHPLLDYSIKFPKTSSKQGE